MATAAAAVLAKARRDVASHFMSANAVSPENAVSFEPARFVQGRVFERMKASGILVEAKPGRWYIDVPRYDASARARRRRAGIAVAAIAVMGAVVATLA